MLYVYVSSKVQSAAQKHSITKRIDAIVQRIESDASLFSLLFSSRFPCWVRRMKNNLRLIAHLKTFGEHQVLHLADILLRGDGEYDPQFLDDPKRWADEHISWDPVEKWLDHRTQVSVEPRPLIPTYLYNWLNRPALMQREDRVIYESDLWVDSLSDENGRPNTQRFASFHRILAHLLEVALSECRIENTRYKNVQRCVDPLTQHCVLFSLIHPHKASQRTILFLLAAFDSHPNEAAIAQVGNQLKLFGSTVARNHLCDSYQMSANDIARYSRRSYPDYIVYDFEIWKKMESDQKINLAMSGEEEDLLHTMIFPAFINGRAGSGKSTMLHYSFAYYCEEYLRTIQADSLKPNDFKQMRPLFLTYSDRLTDKARETVKMILSSHARYGGQNPETTTDPILLDPCFQTFQKFLIQCLPKTTRSTFAGDRYLSFHEFKTRYQKAFPQAKHSAEVCWHAIRTYIKGYHFVDENQEYLSTEEYCQEIPKRHKKISDLHFQEIHTTVWKWYRDLCAEHQFWDDQDLTRLVLQGIANQEIPPTCYAAIFCDEAQDFTRIEFQLILRLSVWSHYRLPTKVESLPFAFAGDPLQTLNPTGFSWESFRANFYENILLPLDPENLRGLTNPERLSLKELQQNYRSPADIVKFTNVIHLWRRVLFNNKTLEPQTPWRTEGGCLPQKGIVNVDLVIHELKTLTAKGFIFLLPCDDGGEVEFIQRSPILSQMFALNDGTKPPTVYTPIGLKGLEDPDIIVCLFGDYYTEQFGQQSLNELTQTETNLQLEYFLNKLYVAVSRSTHSLTILDTEPGDRQFWQAANRHQLPSWLDQMVQSSRKGATYRNHWQTNISPLSNQINLRGVGQIDFTAKAQTWLDSGIENADIEHLRTATYYYERADRQPEMQYCRAWILRLEKRLQQAGQAFMGIEGLTLGTLQPMQEAWNCFWEGQRWTDLKDWLDKNPKTAQSQYQAPVQFMCQTTGKKLLPEVVHTFSVFLCDCQPSFFETHRQDLTWQAVLERYHKAIAPLINTPTPTRKPKQWRKWSKALQTVAESGFKSEELFFLAGHCFYQAQDFAQAVELWEQDQRETHVEYAIAKAQTTALPENLPWFNQADQFDQTVKIWQDNNQPIEQPWDTVLTAIREALKHQKQYSDLLALEIRTQQWQAAIALCKNHDFSVVEREPIIRGMAYDHSVTIDTISQSGQRGLFGDFVDHTIHNPDWTLVPEQVLETCVALEKISEFRVALTAFEEFMDNAQLPKALRTFVKERWLVMKGKQADFARGSGKKRDEDRIRGDRTRKAEEWGIDLTSLSFDVPILPLDDQDNLIKTVKPAVQEPELDSSLLSDLEKLDPIAEQLRDEIGQSLATLSREELSQVKHYVQFMAYLRNQGHSPESESLSESLPLESDVTVQDTEAIANNSATKSRNGHRPRPRVKKH